jgi:hypothetical protein
LRGGGRVSGSYLFDLIDQHWIDVPVRVKKYFLDHVMDDDMVLGVPTDSTPHISGTGAGQEERARGGGVQKVGS